MLPVFRSVMVWSGDAKVPTAVWPNDVVGVPCTVQVAPWPVPISAMSTLPAVASDEKRSVPGTFPMVVGLKFTETWQVVFLARTVPALQVLPERLKAAFELLTSAAAADSVTEPVPVFLRVTSCVAGVPTFEASAAALPVMPTKLSTFESKPVPESETVWAPTPVPNERRPEAAPEVEGVNAALTAQEPPAASEEAQSVLAW